MRKRTLLVLAFALVFAPLASTHEGHEHKIMGTTAAVHENHVEITGTDGKTSSVTLNEKTKILRGTVAAKPADITPGMRIVVRATQTKGKDGKPILVAKEIRLGVAP